MNKAVLQSESFARARSLPNTLLEDVLYLWVPPPDILRCNHTPCTVYSWAFGYGLTSKGKTLVFILLPQSVKGKISKYSYRFNVR